MMKRRARCRKM